MKEIASSTALSKELSTSRHPLVVLDFYAPWCVPCKNLTPVFERLQAKYSSVLFLKVNVEVAEDLVKDYHISAMPTIYFLKKNSQTQKWAPVANVKGADASAIEKAIQTYS